jgi:hypothetical protein
MCRIQNAAEECRRIHQLNLCRVLHRPPAQHEQGSYTPSIQLRNFRNIQHQHTDATELFYPASQVVECDSSHHAAGTAHDRHTLQEFDLKLEFHMSIHTILLWKKFPDWLSLYLTTQEPKSHQQKSSCG